MSKREPRILIVDDVLENLDLLRLYLTHYRFDVTGNITGGGTLQVSYGHDEQADETSFDPVPVTVED